MEEGSLVRVTNLTVAHWKDPLSDPSGFVDAGTLGLVFDLGSLASRDEVGVYLFVGSSAGRKGYVLREKLETVSP